MNTDGKPMHRDDYKAPPGAARTEAKPKAPKTTSRAWKRDRRGRWLSRTLVVVSTVDVIEEWLERTDVEQWHVSVSRRRNDRRPTDAELAFVRKVFGMCEAEEDNHEPGRARHLWLVVDPALRVDCECKEGEATQLEADGFEWQADADADVAGKREKWRDFRRKTGAKF